MRGSTAFLICMHVYTRWRVSLSSWRSKGCMWAQGRRVQCWLGAANRVMLRKVPCMNGKVSANTTDFEHNLNGQEPSLLLVVM